ncbi:OmpH family outer membrane protein [Salinibius halmophilus]|uniref:OmpH family outer membrane protein n=1 Tax=Salinibius halmophilus TaxID=1853216 RepID=UPI001314A765|nr:OmpH family outer membrane protein [Salinibius halmophilus]
MKKLFTFIFATCVSFTAMASNYAVINQELVMFTSQVAQAENARLQADFGDLDRERTALQEELRAMQRQYETDKDILTEEEVATLQEKAAVVQQQVNQLSNQLAQAQQQRQNAFLQRYQEEFVEAIRSVLAETEYDLVLDSSAVIYAEDGLDISERVLEEFNRLTTGE